MTCLNVVKIMPLNLLRKTKRAESVKDCEMYDPCLCLFDVHTCMCVRGWMCDPVINKLNLRTEMFALELNKIKI